MYRPIELFLLEAISCGTLLWNFSFVGGYFMWKSSLGPVNLNFASDLSSQTLVIFISSWSFVLSCSIGFAMLSSRTWHGEVVGMAYHIELVNYICCDFVINL